MSTIDEMISDWPGLDPKGRVLSKGLGMARFPARTLSFGTGAAWFVSAALGLAGVGVSVMPPRPDAVLAHRLFLAADFSAATGGVLLLLWVGQLLAGRAVRRAARRPATFPVLDELEPLLASADTAVGLARFSRVASEPAAWSVVYALRDAVKTVGSQLDSETYSLLSRFIETALNALTYFDQMAPPGSYEGARGWAEDRTRHRLYQEVVNERARITERFRELRGVARPRHRRWSVRSPRLIVAPVSEGTTVYLAVINEGGSGMIQACGQTQSINMGIPIPYPLPWVGTDTAERRIGSGGGGNLVLARTEKWQGFIGNTIELRQQLTLPGADGSDAMRQQPWDPDPEPAWHTAAPVIVSVTFESDPPLASPCQHTYAIDRVKSKSGEPALMIAEIIAPLA